jgi:hypothetical protein
MTRGLRTPLFAAGSVVLALNVVACGGMTPPAAGAPPIAREASVSTPTPLDAPPASSVERAQQALLYPYNLPQYNDFSAEIEKERAAPGASGATGDASSKSR